MSSVGAIFSSWIPGVLSKSQVRGLIDAGHIDGASPNALDHSSLDLHLSEESYVLSKGSVKPFGDRYLTTLKRNHLVEEHAASPDGTFLLERKKNLPVQAAGEAATERVCRSPWRNLRPSHGKELDRSSRCARQTHRGWLT
jgi:hypothetical protein